MCVLPVCVHVLTDKVALFTLGTTCVSSSGWADWVVKPAPTPEKTHSHIKKCTSTRPVNILKGRVLLHKYTLTHTQRSCVPANLL